MKHCKWPRPPLVLGFILGTVIERYLFISIQRYGAGWMLRPVVIVMFALAVLGLLRSFWDDVRAHGGIFGMRSGFGGARFQPANLLPAALLVLVATMMAQSLDWSVEAKIIPMIVGSLAILFGTLTLGNEVFRPMAAPPGEAGERMLAAVEQRTGAVIQPKMHMDVESRISHLPAAIKLGRGAVFFGWMAAFLGAMAMIGLIATVPIFIIAYMRLEGRERWSLTLPMATAMTAFIYTLFDRLLAIPWPPSLLGTLMPTLRVIPGV
jgi:hypothetical protein